MKKLFLLMLVGCIEINTPEQVKNIEYIQDDRTGLCFAVYNLGMQYGSFSNVPCSDQVMKQVDLKKKKSVNGN